MGESLVDRYGRARLAKVVARFYGDVLRSNRLSAYFHDVPMTGLIEHQTLFLEMVMGGPEAFSAKEIERVHRPLGITDDDFEELLRLLERSLLDHEVTTGDAAAVVAGYRELKAQVIGGPQHP